MLAVNVLINKTLRPCREESVDFDNTENLYIEGDNLEALTALSYTHTGKIDVIYIAKGEDVPGLTHNNLRYYKRSLCLVIRQRRTCET